MLLLSDYRGQFGFMLQVAIQSPDLVERGRCGETGTIAIAHAAAAKSLC